MELLFLGAWMGVVGGLIPSPLHFIALAQVGLGRWARAISVLIGPPLVVDGLLLALTFFFYRHIPGSIAHYVAYVGGVLLIAFSIHALMAARGKSREEVANSASMTYASVSVATFAELAAPGTWVYWLTIAGPILAEGARKGYMHVVPFFAGGLVGFYGAAIFSVWLMAWAAALYRQFKQWLFQIANFLLLIAGVFYLLRAALSPG